MITQDELFRLITTALPDASVKVRDLTGGADHYHVEVVSPSFIGKPLVMRHRMVYAAVKDVMGGALHAMQLTTKAPDE